MPAEGGAGYAEQVEPDAEGEGADHHAEDGVEPQVAERQRPVVHPVPAGDGERDAEIEKFFAQPVQRDERDGAFAVEDDGDQRPHGPDVGKGAAAVETAGLRPVEPETLGEEDGKNAAPDPRGDAEQRQGEEPGGEGSPHRESMAEMGMNTNRAIRCIRWRSAVIRSSEKGMRPALTYCWNT